MTRVPLAYATRHGSTREVAEAVGNVALAAGAWTVCRWRSSRSGPAATTRRPGSAVARSWSGLRWIVCGGWPRRRAVPGHLR
jgi:hypothetical protein